MSMIFFEHIFGPNTTAKPTNAVAGWQAELHNYECDYNVSR